MEAVSRGAAEAGGHVIGVTCTEIEHFRPGSANRWVKEQIHLETLESRLMYLLTNCEAAIALPGGIGTLAEIVILWNKLQVKTIPPRPFVVMGEGWKIVFEALFSQQGAYIPLSYRSFLHFYSSIDQACSFIKNEIN